MIKNDVIFGTTPCETVAINKIELSARLAMGIDINDDTIAEHIDEYHKKVCYRYAYTKIAYKTVGDACFFEESFIKSPALAKVLKDSNEVILLAVSAGAEVDKLISRAAIQSPASSFYIDAIASAGIESYIDHISKLICKDLTATRRFSPGYADFPLEFQAYLLDRVSASETLGITLTKEYFMLPTKSITAVIGINSSKGA